MVSITLPLYRESYLKGGKSQELNSGFFKVNSVEEKAAGYHFLHFSQDFLPLSFKYFSAALPGAKIFFIKNENLCLTQWHFCVYLHCSILLEVVSTQYAPFEVVVVGLE